jgi:hypothetical protein
METLEKPKKSFFNNPYFSFLLPGFAFFILAMFSFSLANRTLQASKAGPFSKATALITSKDPDEKLSIKSADLPKKGDVISVDQYTYGAASVGDSICVRHKETPENPQYGTEFVGLGNCQK